ncbi:hypothetical protein R75461_05273 [Paraburkholderia nemoris]|uniref:hypothetical protein n=1 Tax=Paraburkholderia nemoris TaxID=2793076 RepID=UPI00190A9B87|nr:MULTISPECIES: hypothetical protein [Paraburkholderia]MBK3783933.1 hypothetical protein [Paraburkholderia aspalathi]MBK5148047.1 hypothetical protein [Burkholderia sp. R-69608]CAE6802889.1 hypothetical protein R75461_05273 [Paraburkholderia nemoris]CAE6876223.1 hypothetical protein R69608_01425 [Paraburkholderia nemoris]
MIEWLGLFYGIAKDVKDWLKWEEQTKQIDGQWLDRSGFANHMKASGIDLYWSRPDSIPTRELDGWSVLCELDQKNRIRYRLVRYDGTTLLGKPAKGD